MKENDFYVLVDTRSKQVIGKLESLPEYWKNISGLSNFSEDELSDLSWSGNDGLGWIKVNSPLLSEYTSSPENLSLNKNQFKEIVCETTKIKKEIGITFNNIRFPIDKNIILDLNIKKLQADQYPDKTFVYKIYNQYYTFTAEEIKTITSLVNEYDIECSLWEMNIFNQIESCTSISDFININYDI